MRSLFKFISPQKVIVRSLFTVATSTILYQNYKHYCKQPTFLDEAKSQFQQQYATINVQKLYWETSDIEEFARDANSYHAGITPLCVFYPTTTEDVQQFVKICNKYKIFMVPYCKGTSLEGNSLPTLKRTAIINFSYMNNIIEIRENDFQVDVQPGVGWMDLNEELAKQELYFPVDPGPGAGIGGMINTSCSGTNAFKYGTMRDWVMQLEVVLADGRIINLGTRAKKSSAGYNLQNLFVGSEGTLGIVTKATLKVAPLPKHVQVVTVCFKSLFDLSEAVHSLMKSALPLQCVELLDSSMVNIIMKKQNGQHLIKDSNLLLLKLQSENSNQQIKEIEEITKKFKGFNHYTATTKKEVDQLWHTRKNALWTTQQYGREVKGPQTNLWTTDVCVPISQLAENITETQKEIKENNLIAPLIGHVGDGNYHIEFVVDYNDQKEWNIIKGINQRMVERALKSKGTCTGEHGIGVGKRDFLKQEKGEDVIQLMREIKKVFDPYGLLNPNKIFTLDQSQEENH